MEPTLSLKPHPLNPNKHPDSQIKLLAKIIRETGWRHPIVVSLRSGFIVTGHGRHQAAMFLGLPEVPVDFQDFESEEAEIAHLVADNRLAELADMDNEKLNGILQDLKNRPIDFELSGFTIDDKDLKRLEKAAGEKKDEEDLIDDAPDELPGAAALKPDMAFESKEAYNIPMLRSDMLAEMPAPITTWIGPHRTEPWEHFYLYVHGNDSSKGLDMARTVVSFYAEDEKFEECWAKPDVFATKLLNRKPLQCITPNFSLWYGMPLAVMIWNTYRARWVGRYWQEAGIRIVPDIQFSHPDTREFVIAGVPKNATCLSMQIQTAKKTVEEVVALRDNIKYAIEKLEPQSMFFYGGDTAQEILEGALPPGFPHNVVENAIMKRRRFIEPKKGKKK